MISTVFQYGEFGEHAVRMSALSLSAYAGGLVAFVAVKVLAAGFHARQQMRTPVRIAVVAMIANVVLNFALVGPLRARRARARELPRRLAERRTAAEESSEATGCYRPRPGWGRLLAQVLALRRSRSPRCSRGFKGIRKRG